MNLLALTFLGLAENQILELIWFAAVFSILAMSLNLVVGQAGLFHLGPVGFFAIGGVASFFATHANYLGLDFLLGILFGAVWAVAAALLVALPTLRLRGDYFAIATLGFAAIVQVSLEVFFIQGVYGVPSLNLFGMEVTALDAWLEENAPSVGARVSWRHLELVVVLTFAGLTYWLLQRLSHAPFGRTLRAIREDEIAAHSLGKNVVAFKLKAFVLSAVLASLAGSLYVHHLQVFNPADYNFGLTITLLVMIILGGLGSNQGAVIGAVLVTIINEVSKVVARRVAGDVDTAALNIMLFSGLLIALMVLRPQGILGDHDVDWRRLFRRGKAPTSTVLADEEERKEDGS